MALVVGDAEPMTVVIVVPNEILVGTMLAERNRGSIQVRFTYAGHGVTTC